MIIFEKIMMLQGILIIKQIHLDQIQDMLNIINNIEILHNKIKIIIIIIINQVFINITQVKDKILNNRSIEAKRIIE